VFIYPYTCIVPSDLIKAFSSLSQKRNTSDVSHVLILLLTVVYFIVDRKHYVYTTDTDSDEN